MAPASVRAKTTRCSREAPPETAPVVRSCEGVPEVGRSWQRPLRVSARSVVVPWSRFHVKPPGAFLAETNDIACKGTILL